MGYQPTEDDRAFVDRAVMAGSDTKDIATCLKVSIEELEQHYKYEIVTARERLKGAAIQVLLDGMKDGSLDAAKYVLARAAGWNETNKDQQTKRPWQQRQSKPQGKVALLQDARRATKPTSG